VGGAARHAFGLLLVADEYVKPEGLHFLLRFHGSRFAGVLAARMREWWRGKMQVQRRDAENAEGSAENAF
jgi:hypothetical protein